MISDGSCDHWCKLLAVDNVRCITFRNDVSAGSTEDRFSNLLYIPKDMHKLKFSLFCVAAVCLPSVSHSKHHLRCDCQFPQTAPCSDSVLSASVPCPYCAACTGLMHGASSSMVSSSSLLTACVIRFSSSHSVSQRYATRMSGTLVRRMSLLSWLSLM